MFEQIRKSPWRKTQRNQKNILTCYPYNSETRLMFNAYRARSTVTKMPDYPVSTEFGILCDDLQDITYIPNKRSITARSD